MKIEFREMKHNLQVPGSVLILMISLLVLVLSCDSDDEYPDYNPPPDHTISKEGVMHRSGLNDPTQNCANCHGNDLTGGTSQVSCYECHGQEW